MDVLVVRELTADEQIVIGVVAAEPDGMQCALDLIDARHRLLATADVPIDWERETYGIFTMFRPSSRARYDGGFFDVSRWSLGGPATPAAAAGASVRAR